MTIGYRQPGNDKLSSEAASGQAVEDADRIVDELFDTVDLPPGVGQGTMHRDNWYR